MKAFKILVLLVVGFIFVQCNTSFIGVLFPDRYITMKKRSTIKFGLDKDAWANSPIKNHGYYITDDGVKCWLFRDGSLCGETKDGTLSYWDWYMYDFVDSCVVTNYYTPVFKHLYDVESDTMFYVESDTTLLRPYYEVDSVTGQWWLKYKRFQFVPTDTMPRDTCWLRKFRWMWKDGKMPQDTIGGKKTSF